MRSTEIDAYAKGKGFTPPTYRQMDLWTRIGRIPVEFKGDQHGRYRDWPVEAVDTACLAARFISAGMSADLAFAVARAVPDHDGERLVYLDDQKPLVRVAVAFFG